MSWKIQPVDSASVIHVMLVPLISPQSWEDATFSFGIFLSHIYAPTSEMRNQLVFQIAFTGTHADFLVSIRGLRKTHLIPLGAHTPWGFISEVFLLGEVETSYL